MQGVLIVSSWIIFGIICSKIARKKFRNAHMWFFLGLSFCLIALIIIYFLKPLRTATQDVIIPKDPLLFLKNDKNYWYYLDIQKKQIGPISIKKLFDNYLEGSISEKTFVWNDTLTDWKKLEEVSFFSDFKNTQT